MKKITSLVLTLVMFATIFCGCTQEIKVNVNTKGSGKIILFTAIPVDAVEEMADAEGMTVEDMVGQDLEVKKVNGKDCYVEEITEKFSSTKRANKYMLSEEVGYFEEFKLTKVGFSGKLYEDITDGFELYGDEFVFKMTITWPYIVTNTNGTLSEDKKTVTFDLTEDEEIYAYTWKSSKSKKVYFKKEYLKSNSSAYLDWNKVDGATKYKVSYKASGDKKWKSTTTTKTAITIKDLKAGKKHYFKVTAITKSDKYTSMATSVSTLKTVTAKVKSKTDKSVKLGWKQDDNADGYIVYKRASKKAEWSKVKTIKSNSTTVYNVKKLKAEKKYYFKVISYCNENGKTIKSSGKALSTKTY